MNWSRLNSDYDLGGRNVETGTQLVLMSCGEPRYRHMDNAGTRVTRQVTDANGNLILYAQRFSGFANSDALTALSHTGSPPSALSPPPLLAGYTWACDDANRVTEFVSTTDGTAPYTYDNTDHVTGAAYDYQADEAHTYDANGNRTGAGYATAANNRTTSDGRYSYEYDAEGNRTRRTEKRWYRITAENAQAYNNACVDRLKQLYQETRWMPEADRTPYHFQEMSKFRNKWLKEFLENRNY